uniref:RHS repeat-associated core domain-containing protein n=1 Tax=unclassified Streptomyces TaxID=2593676 RepID=UPI000565F541
SYLISDHQGTAMTAIAAGTLAITRRKQLPFGQLRSEQSTAFGNRGFVGGTNDPTGLTHLGAREYDPTLGRFLSVDPVIDINDPAQMNAYSYAHNNPLTKSDPDGLRPDGPAGGASYNDDRWSEDRGGNSGYTYKSGKWVWHFTPKSWFDPRYQAYRANPSTYKVYHYNAAEAAAAKKQAEKDRIAREEKVAQERREMGVKETLSAMTVGNLKKLWNSYSAGDSAGRCISLSAGFVVGGTLQGCLVTTKRPDGKTDYGLSGNYGAEFMSFGTGVQYEMYGSNADDFDQLRGDSTGANASIGLGVEVSGSHEYAINRSGNSVNVVSNSRGEPVTATSLSVGVGLGVELGVQSSYANGIIPLFTW